MTAILADNMRLKSKKILVTGGASFIGSHLVDALVDRGCRVRAADNFQSGKRENIEHHIKHKSIELIKGDLRDSGFAKMALRGIDLVFHLAADHGGRGYIENHQSGPATNLLLDGQVFYQSLKSGVEKIIYASSACVYPVSLQSDQNKKVRLVEPLVKPPFEADNMYGWAKLMGELSLKSFRREHGIKAASLRYFSVYGPRGLEGHSIMSMIAKAFIRQNPYEIWGNGNQIRNWTYVSDIVDGSILAAEKIDDGSAVNLGTTEGISVKQAVKMILNRVGYRPKIKYLLQMPIGPLNRVADNRLAVGKLGWTPQVKFAAGINKTIDWYFNHKSSAEVKKVLRYELSR